MCLMLSKFSGQIFLDIVLAWDKLPTSELVSLCLFPLVIPVFVTGCDDLTLEV